MGQPIVGAVGFGATGQKRRMAMVDFDKAKEMAGEHPDQVNEGIEKGGDFLDEKTGGQYAEQVDKGQEAARGQLGGQDTGSAGGTEQGEQAEQQ